MRTAFAATALAVVLVTYGSSAQARHARAHHARHHHRARHVERIAAPASPGLFGISFGAAGSGSRIIDEARRWVGTNPTGKRALWCARFMNFVLHRVGLPGTNSDMAKSFAAYGHRVGPQVGAIAVLTRHGGGHVGVVTGIAPNGDPIILSGNHGHTVGEGAYSRSRVIAYVAP